MNFIRPEVKARLWNWRECIVGAVLAALGALWALTEGGLLAGRGVALAVTGGVLVYAGYQRSRFRTGSGAPGLVQVDERQVTYFGPDTGGALSIDALARVDLDPVAQPHPAWLLTDVAGQTLAIPTHAENAEALFDVFATLEGIRTEAMLAQLRAKPARRVRIWAAPPRRLH